MATENPLPFLRGLNEKRPLPETMLLFGQQAFLREYLLDSIRRRLIDEGFEYAGFQVGAGDDFGGVIEELLAPGLFASSKLIACRVLKSRRERGEGEGRATRAAHGVDEAALAAAIERAQGPSRLLVIYEGMPPAKLRQTIEKRGVAIGCNRPFDNQIAQYAQIFARALGLKLSSSASELVVARHGSDLAALNNVLSKAAIGHARGESVEAPELREPEAQGVPEVFELAESLARGQAARSLALLDRALATGRDTFELLAVEIVPALRRMLLVASAMNQRDFTIADAARLLGFSPSSPLALRAVEGARRFGLERLNLGYKAAAELDAGFKLGDVRGREQALSGLILELLAAS